MQRHRGTQGIDSTRRELLRALFWSAGAAALPLGATAAGSGRGLHLPAGPLGAQALPPLQPARVLGAVIEGVDERVLAPAGFELRVVARADVNPLAPAEGALPWHRFPDGGAVFATPEDGGWIYVSNCERTPGGGVGALRFDAHARLVAHQRILEGTRQNCAGGPTPWGTWLSCEEISGSGQVYECDPRGIEPAAVKPALGAFAHEAAAIDARHHVCYLTEDAPAGRLRRFVADAGDVSRSAAGLMRMGLSRGRLQRLQIEGLAPDTALAGSAEASAWLRQPRRVEWVDDRDALGTRFDGGEGLWLHELPAALAQVPPGGRVATRGVLFFSTKGDTRLWALDVENQLLELVYDTRFAQTSASFGPDFRQVDNVCASPGGDVLVAEDGPLARIGVVVPQGPLQGLLQIAYRDTEITGLAFTPDGSRLYFSSQRGPSGADGGGRHGTTYEMTIPPRYRPPARPGAAPAPAAAGPGSGA